MSSRFELPAAAPRSGGPRRGAKTTRALEPAHPVIVVTEEWLVATTTAAAGLAELLPALARADTTVELFRQSRPVPGTSEELPGPSAL